VQKPVPISRVLWIQSLGFLVIIGVSLLIRILDLRSLVLANHPYISEFGASALEMLLVFRFGSWSWRDATRPNSACITRGFPAGLRFGATHLSQKQMGAPRRVPQSGV